MRRDKCLQNIICTVAYIHPWKTNVFGSRVGWRLGKINRAVISVTLTCRAFCSPSCYLLHSLSRTGDHYRESQDRASSKNKKRLNGFMKIIWADLHKAKNNIKNKIESSVEIYRRFRFVNSSETFQHLCGFQETRRENSTAKTCSPEQPSAFRDL